MDLRSSSSNPRKPLGSLISRVLGGSRACKPRTGRTRITDQRGTVRENSRQSQTRLSVSNRAEMLDGYAAGVPVRELATQFNVHRGTVREIARQAGLAARQPELHDAIRQDAAQFYANGLTLAQVATQLGISNEAVRSAVIARRGHDPPWRSSPCQSLSLRTSPDTYPIHDSALFGVVCFGRSSWHDCGGW